MHWVRKIAREYSDSFIFVVKILSKHCGPKNFLQYEIPLIKNILMYLMRCYLCLIIIILNLQKTIHLEMGVALLREVTMFHTCSLHLNFKSIEKKIKKFIN